MADFGKIIGFVRQFEGGYVNDPDDAGGETYCGVSRVHHPHWEGWVLVDMNKPLKHNQIVKDSLLEDMVNTFYYKKYWNAVGGDKIAGQAVANMACDWQVHSGDNCTKALQNLVGVKPDGDVGPKTIAAINACDPVRLFTQLKERRIMYYRAVVRHKPSNGKYLKGWIRRAENVPVS
jgi:lysozyme family protein